MGIQPIDEFPFFSFLLGDNHPHVLALPFVLLAIGLAFNLFLRQITKQRLSPRMRLAANPNPARRGGIPVAFALDNDWLLFVFSALILGCTGLLEHLGLAHLPGRGHAGLWNGAGDPEKVAWIGQTIYRSVILGFGLGILSVLLYIFFYLSFSSQAAGILPYVFPPTRLPQYLVMFGTFIFLLGCFLVAYLRKPGAQRGQRLKSAFTWWWRILLICIGLYFLILLLIALVLYSSATRHRIVTLAATLQTVLGGMSLSQAFGASIVARLRDPWLMLLLSAPIGIGACQSWAACYAKRSCRRGFTDRAKFSAQPSLSSEPFVFILIFTGLALTLVVEFLYLRDSFGVRMNTVFKFYYQAWVMLGCASAYAVWWLLDRLEKPAVRVLFVTGATSFHRSGPGLPRMAIPTRAADFAGAANLDGASMHCE